MHTTQRVAVTVGTVEVVAQELLAGLGRQALPGDGSRLGEGAAKTLQRLEAALGVDQQQGQRRVHRAGLQGRLLSQAGVAGLAGQEVAHGGAGSVVEVGPQGRR